MSEYKYTGREAFVARSYSIVGSEVDFDNEWNCGPEKFGSLGMIWYGITGKNIAPSEEDQIVFIDVIEKSQYNTRYSANNLSDKFKIGDFTKLITSNQFNKNPPIYILKDITIDSFSYANYTSISIEKSISNNIITTKTIAASSSRKYIQNTVQIVDLEAFISKYNENSSEQIEIAPFELLNPGLTDRENYENIASAIRERGEFTDTYYPSEMSQAILDIPHDEIPEPIPDNATISALNNRTNITNINSTDIPSLSEGYMRYGLFASSGNIESIQISDDMVNNQFQAFDLGHFSLAAAFKNTVFNLDLGDNALMLHAGCLADNGYLVNLKMNAKSIVANNTPILNNTGLNANFKLVLTNDTIPTLIYSGSGIVPENWLGINEYAKIYVVADLVDEYKSANYWNNYADRIYPITDEILALFD